LTEPPAVTSGQVPLGQAWRAQAESAQEAVVPDGPAVVSCPAPPGSGGLGRHFQEIVQALDRRGQAPHRIWEGSPRPADETRPVSPALMGARAAVPLTRFSPAWRMWAVGVRFDADAAHRLPASEHLLAFNGRAALQLAAARRAGYRSCALVSANCHLRHVLRQYERAQRAYPLEHSWAAHLLRRNLREYERADRIYVASAYVWESFVAEGFSDDALSLFPLTPDPRFRPARRAAASSTFNVVYVGSLSVAKGVPLLIDSVSRLPHHELRLKLVGGWGSRGMRRFIGEACARDSRIEVCHGDPLPRLLEASLGVHPSYSEGFGYAAAEALACGVPVVVSEDTGMKELIERGRTGLVLPTGDADAMAETIDAAYRGEILGA
jgi:glycosyltransferase involved in cell wall biosynthesis